MSKPIAGYKFQIINHDKRRYTYTDTLPKGITGNVEVLPIEMRKTIPNNGYKIRFN